MTLTATPTRPITALDPPLGMFRGRKVSRKAVPDDADQTRARYDFLMEKLDGKPEAFASEYDVQTLMALCPPAF